MPKTRSDTHRDAKVAEIVTAAERQLRAGGYGALSLAAIARELGVAQNTIYWYFTSKDELVVATMRRILEQTLKQKPKYEDVGVVDSVAWVTNSLEPFYRLKVALSEKVFESAVVAEFIQQTNEMLRAMLDNVLRKHLPEGEVDLAVETFAATVEGAFARGLDEPRRRELFAFALQRLIAE